MECDIIFIDKSNFLAHYGVMGMKWGVRKSIRKLNSFSRHASRIDYKVNKSENKYNKFVTKYQIAKNRGLINKASKYESKAWKQAGKLAGELYPKQKEAQSTVLKGKEHVEKYLKTPLKVVKGKAVNKVVPYDLGSVMGVYVQTIPYAKFKKDKSRSKLDLNKMGSKSFYNYINSSPKGSLPISIDRTDYIYKKAGIKKKK